MASSGTIREFHLFAGIGGGIYGGKLLGHTCCGAVEISDFCKTVLRQRMRDLWIPQFPIYGDIHSLSGYQFRDKFDILCGGFPCQAFSHAAHGKNIAEKNLWGEMLRFIVESEAPVVFAENVTHKAINKAAADLTQLGYQVRQCSLSCEQLGADHRRTRHWLLAVKDKETFSRVAKHLKFLLPLKASCWKWKWNSTYDFGNWSGKREQLKAIGNAQSPIAAATAMRILVDRFIKGHNISTEVTEDELSSVAVRYESFIRQTRGKEFGLVHTPTATANVTAQSMMKHRGCRNFKEVFGTPTPANFEYLMGLPIGAASPERQGTGIPKCFIEMRGNN